MVYTTTWIDNIFVVNFMVFVVSWILIFYKIFIWVIVFVPGLPRMNSNQVVDSDSSLLRFIIYNYKERET